MKSDPGEVHERWMARRNRIQEGSEYKDEWYAEQCLRCWHYVPLTGALREDYGACTNPQSPFDQRVMFEHDGCEAFEPSRVVDAVEVSERSESTEDGLGQ